jgi:putative iron-dependent peroxidase
MTRWYGCQEVAEWEALPIEMQERVIGRSKPDSVELENKPPESHVARTDQDTFGNIFRRNMPYGTVREHGTMFVGFSAEQKRLARMLDSMAGLVTGVRDALTRF